MKYNLGNTQAKYLKYILPLVLTACAIDPAASDNYVGLGTSPIGKRLRFSLFLGESMVDESISNMVNIPQVLSQTDKRPPLEKLGFKCDQERTVICTYDGSATSVITDRNRTESFKTSVHIEAFIEKNVVKVRSKIIKTNF